MSAGEIGHTVIATDAGLGRRTLENLASRTAVVNRLSSLVASNYPSSLVEKTGGDLSKIRSKMLASAWEEGDSLTVEILQEAAHHIGVAAANAVTLLSLSCVVIGGGMTDALGKSWVEAIVRQFKRYVFPAELRKCAILPSALGDDAGIVGAAMLLSQEDRKLIQVAKK